MNKNTVRLRKEFQNPLLRSKFDTEVSWQTALRQAIVRPVETLVLSSIIPTLATLSAIAYGYLYLMFTTITTVFEESYGFLPNTVGLTFLGIGVGMIVGVIIFGVISDRRLKKAQAYKMEMKPEYRLNIMIPGGFCIPVGLFIYGWTAEKHVFWFVPILGTAIAGAGIMAYFVRTASPARTSCEEVFSTVSYAIGIDVSGKSKLIANTIATRRHVYKPT